MTEANATDVERIPLSSVETWRLKTAADAVQHAGAALEAARQRWFQEVSARLKLAGLSPKDLERRWALEVDEVDDRVFLQAPPNGHPEEEISPD